MTAPVFPPGGARPPLASLVLLVVTALCCYLCYLLALPFLPALAWALTLAVLFAPLQRWLEAKLKHPGLAAFVAVTVIAIIVVVPLSFVVTQLIGEATKGAALIQLKVSSGEWRTALQAQPRLAPLVAQVEQYFDVPGAVKTAVAWLSASVGPIVKGSVTQLLGFGLTFYVLFYFLRDRRAGLATLHHLSPLTRAEMDRLFTHIGDTIHATVYGSLAVACIQGFLGGLMFWWLDLPAPVLWGGVMALLAVVPMLGAFIVWAPAAVYLAIEGNVGGAVVLTLWGVLVIATIDNFLLPIFVGDRLKLHPLLAFISVVGGIFLFGAAGLILGPVVLTAAIALLNVWSERRALENDFPSTPPAA